ncbi:MAG: HEPN domain-containing protein [Nanoarchaeota archaeon]|nr:HEPN domain-containing protein [Nanoarchaeota archaeon]
MKKVEPNKEVALSYLGEAEKTLSKVNALIEEGDFVWASARIYYCAYYSIYSFLQRIGIKSENHDCSIELVKKLVKKDFVNNIDSFKENRVDSQYYLKTGQKEKMLRLYLKVKEFYLDFREIVENLTDDDIKNIIDQINKQK